MLVRPREVVGRAVGWWSQLDPLTSDALLYGIAAPFAFLLALETSQHAQSQWGNLAVAPYAAAAAAALVLRVSRVRRVQLARVVLLVLVIVGTVAIPLGLEAKWRSAQPEVGVISRAGQLLSKGDSPYRAYDRHGRVVNEIPGLPAFESFFPYFPLMGVFGLPSADTHESKGLTDARIVMTLMTLIVSGAALALLRLDRRRKIRVAQVLIALPTGALFLATGGDDMPILALCLLGVAALQRHQRHVAGITLGVAAAMKLTAWPLALGALLVARDGKGRPAWRTVMAWIVAIVLATTVPFAIRDPWAFVSNVFAFPLGLAGVASPAASNLPGHLLTQQWPVLGHFLAPAAFVVGGYFAARYGRRHWPLSLSQVLGMLAVAFAVVMCVATATRVGYVIYPINFALWSACTREAVATAPAPRREMAMA